MIILNIILGAAESLMLPLCLYFFMSHNARTVYRSRWITLLCFLVYGVGMIIATMVLRNQFLICMAGIGLVLIIGVCSFHTSPQSLFWDVLYQVVIYLCQVSVIYGVITVMEIQSITNMYILGNVSIGIKLLLEFLATWLLIRVVDGEKKAPLKWQQILCLFFLPVISLFLMLAFIEVGEVYFQLYNIGLVVLCFVLLILLNVYVIYLLGYLFRAKNLENDLQVYQIQSRMQFEHYEEVEKKYEDSRRVIHDMKNHLQAIAGLYERQEIEKGEIYMRDMYRMLDALGEQYYTDNKLLNIILNEKFRRAQQQGIRTEAAIGNAELEKLRDIDMTTIFSNILDNAIEAAGKCTDPYINLKMDRINDFVVVRLSNSSQEGDDKPGHKGFGMGNVQRTLQVYHGTIQTQQQGQEFQTTIMFPV